MRISRPGRHCRPGPRHELSFPFPNTRTSGLFDGVVAFDRATGDPTTGNMQAAYLPNSQFTQLAWDYLHPNHAGYNTMGLAVDIGPFAPDKPSQ
jgi:hypothetical protein